MGQQMNKQREGQNQGQIPQLPQNMQPTQGNTLSPLQAVTQQAPYLQQMMARYFGGLLG
jgi:hypothetical protein